MLEIKTLDDIRGNNVTIYSIKTLLQRGTFPNFVILSGHMGVGKSTVANLVANALNESNLPVVTYNFGLELDMATVESEVFKMNPAERRAFVFEELHGLDKKKQTALLTMLDKQPSNVYIIATTTELYKILNTIKSRATKWDFKLLGNRQLAQLLDDYLKQLGASMSAKAKNLLVSSAFGCPRDLMKNTDLAISGDFDQAQLAELLGKVNEDLIFTVLSALKSSGTGFATSVRNLLEETSEALLIQFRDFYTRFLLERKGVEGATIDGTRISALNSLYTDDELMRIGRCLVKATSATLILELTVLNLELTKASKSSLVGQQRDAVAQSNASASVKQDQTDAQSKKEKAQVTRSSLTALKLGEGM